MIRNWIAFIYISLIVFVLFDFTSTSIGQSKDVKRVTCTGKVIDEQGQPIAGVKVSLNEMAYDEATYTFDPNQIGQVHTGPDGEFSFSETVKDNRYRYGYIVAEKEGLALGFDNWSMRDGDKKLEIKLGQPKELAGIIVDENDKPVLDAEVAVIMLALGEGEERKHLNSLVIPKLLTRNTNAMGKFVFTHIPSGATAEFIVKKTGRATVSTYKRTGGPYQKYNFKEGQKDIKLVLPVEAKIEGLVIEKTTGKPVSSVKIRYSSGQEAGYFRPKPLVSKEDGTFVIDALTANRYVVELVQPRDELADWASNPLEAITGTGRTKSGVKIELSKGGVLEVKLTDAVTKEPMEMASVGVNSLTGGRYQSSRSDINGYVRMRLMPGSYQINNINKQGYSSLVSQDSITIEDGKTERLEYELTGVPKITGVVRDIDGKVLEGVKLKVCPMGAREDITTDSEGKFEMAYDPSMWGGPQIPITYLVCRYEERNLAAAMQIDDSMGAVDVKLKPGITFTGKVVDPNGNDIEGAGIYVNMRASNWGSPIDRDFPKTDKRGKFEIKAIPVEQKYNLYVRSEGYGEIRTEVDMADAVDNRHDFGTITLPIANLSVSGMVVDDNNKPVAGARINSYGENQPYGNTQTDVAGKFTLEKVCAGRIRINANKSGTSRLYGYVETEGGATDVRIVISERPTSTRYEPRRPPSLVGRPLPELKEVGVNLSPTDTDGKMLLVCFFDMEQRPSRHCITQLAKQAEQLKSKGLIVVAVQVTKIDKNTLNEWATKYNIPFSVGMIQGDAEKARFAWGVRSLPWLILTDSKHIARACGFSLGELDNNIQEVEGR